MHLQLLCVWELTCILWAVFHLTVVPSASPLSLVPGFATFDEAFVNFFAPFSYLEVIPVVILVSDLTCFNWRA